MDPPSSSFATEQGWTVGYRTESCNNREGSERDDDDDNDQEGVDERRLANSEMKRLGLTLKAQKIEEDIIRAKQRYDSEEKRIKKAMERNATKYKARQTYLHRELQIAEANEIDIQEDHRIRGKEQGRIAEEQAERDRASTQRLEQMICNLYFQPLDSPASIQLKLQRLEEDQRAAVAVEDSLYEKLILEDNTRRKRIWKELKLKIDKSFPCCTESTEFVAVNESVWEKLLSDGYGWMRFVSPEARQYYSSIHREFELYERRPLHNCDDSCVKSPSSNLSPSTFDMKKSPVSQDTVDRIKQDAHRTFSNFGQHSQTAAFLINRRESQYVKALNSLLVNAAQYFGYCQGMSYIAANFLLYNTEIDAFILFCYIMRDKNLRVLFDPSSSCLVLYINELEQWLKLHCRDLYIHFKDIGFTGYCYGIQWFNTCYLASNPGNLSRCVMDMLLVDVKDTLLRIGVCILENIKNQLIDLDLDQTQDRFKVSVLGVRTMDVLYKALTLNTPCILHNPSISSPLKSEVELLKRLDPATCIYHDEIDGEGKQNNEYQESQTEISENCNEVMKKSGGNKMRKLNIDEISVDMNECSENNQRNTINTVHIDKAEQAVADFEEELNRLYDEQAKVKANQNANQYLRGLLADSRNEITSSDINSKSMSNAIPLQKRFSIQPAISPQDKFEAIKLYDKGFTQAMILIERLIIGVVVRKR